MKRINQRGFAIVETLLVVVIIVALVGIGVYVWKSQQATNATLDATNSASQSQGAHLLKPGNKQSAQQHLTIKEWNIKVPLTADINDAYYYVSSDVDNAVFLSKTVYIGTNCAADNISLGLIMRFTKDEIDPETKETYLSRFNNAVKVGDYYYGYVHPQAACDGTVGNDRQFDEAEGAKASASMTEFSNATAKIVKE